MFANQAMSAEQRLTKAVVSIMHNPKYVALSGVLMVGSRSVSDTVPTACTNGRDEEYGRAFIEKLTDAQLRFVVLHECYHKMYRHLITWRHLYDENPKLANVACDFVINQQIVDDNADGWAAPIEGICLDAKYRGWDSAAVFDDLRKQAESQPDGGAGGEGGGLQSLDDHDWEGAQSMTAEEEQQLAKDIDTAIRQGAMAVSQMGSGGERTVADLLEAQVDWREVLRDFVTTTCSGNDYSTWARPNRRYMSTGVYMPSGISESVGELVIAIDTSASVGERELRSFLSEVKGCCDTVRPSKVRLLYWDTAVCADEVYLEGELDTMAQSTKPAGGGGTSVTCVPQYMAENHINPQAVLVLTDGHLGGSWGDWSAPVLWCILDNKTANPTTGKQVHIKSSEI